MVYYFAQSRTKHPKEDKKIFSFAPVREEK